MANYHPYTSVPPITPILPSMCVRDVPEVQELGSVKTWDASRPLASRWREPQGTETEALRGGHRVKHLPPRDRAMRPAQRWREARALRPKSGPVGKRPRPGGAEPLLRSRRSRRLPSRGRASGQDRSTTPPGLMSVAAMRRDYCSYHPECGDHRPQADATDPSSFAQAYFLRIG